LIFSKVTESSYDKAIKDQVSENLEAINKQFQSQNYFSNQESESLASAELQNVIKMAIGQYGGQLVSTQGLPSENQKQFLKIVVSVRLMTNAEIGFQNNIIHFEALNSFYYKKEVDRLVELIRMSLLLAKKLQQIDNKHIDDGSFS
jgi:hypothetical protein